VPSTAYAVLRVDVNVWVEVKPFNKLCVVASRVVTHKAVEFSGYIIVVKYSAYNIGLGGPNMVSEEVAKGYNNISLFEVGICSLVSYLSVPQGLALNGAKLP
jgi:hypothetical protein